MPESKYGEKGGVYANLFDAHPPFQIDGNFGGAAAVAEMLVQSTADQVILLPALPATWASGSVSGLKTRGGYTLSMNWDKGKVVRYSLTRPGGGKPKVRVNGVWK